MNDTPPNRRLREATRRFCAARSASLKQTGPLVDPRFDLQEVHARGELVRAASDPGVSERDRALAFAFVGGRPPELRAYAPVADAARPRTPRRLGRRARR
jgi:hypothetical protein